jgi:hypothetical protein
MPHLQENSPPQDRTAGLCLESWGGSRTWAFFYGQGIPTGHFCLSLTSLDLHYKCINLIYILQYQQSRHACTPTEAVREQLNHQPSTSILSQDWPLSLQGYLAHKKMPTPSNPPRTLGIGLR